MKPVPENDVHCFKHARAHPAGTNCPDCEREWLSRKIAQMGDEPGGLMACSPELYKEIKRTHEDHMPEQNDTATHERPRRLLAVWTPTEYEGQYPPYMNVTQIGSMIALTVRGPIKDSGEMGDTVTVELNMATFGNVFQDTCWKFDPAWPSWVLKRTGTEYADGEKPVHKLDRQDG